MLGQQQYCLIPGGQVAGVVFALPSMTLVVLFESIWLWIVGSFHGLDIFLLLSLVLLLVVTAFLVESNALQQCNRMDA